MILHTKLDVDAFRKAQEEPELLESDSDSKKNFSTKYADNFGFQNEILNSLWDALEQQIKQQLESRMGTQLSDVESEVQKIKDKIQASPAGFSLSTFGLGEFLKNASHKEVKATELNIILKINEKASVLDPLGIELLVIDNGRGFPASYLEKDPDRKKNNANLSNVLKVKDPQYKEGKIETSVEVLSRSKNISTKQEIGEISAGKGLYELAKAASVSTIDEPGKVLGHMLICNIDDLKKTSYIALVEEAKISLPTTGAITYIHSPVLDETALENCNLSTMYKDYLKSIQFAKAREQADLEIDDEQNFSLKTSLGEEMEESNEQDIPSLSSFNLQDKIRNSEENDSDYDSDRNEEEELDNPFRSRLQINVELKSNNLRRKEEKLILTVENPTEDIPTEEIQTEPMPMLDSTEDNLDYEDTPTISVSSMEMDTPSQGLTPFSVSSKTSSSTPSSLDTPFSKSSSLSSLRSPSSINTPLSRLDENDPVSPSADKVNSLEKTPRSTRGLSFFSPVSNKEKKPFAEGNELNEEHSKKRKWGKNG